jgi:hypothetical protein
MWRATGIMRIVLVIGLALPAAVLAQEADGVIDNRDWDRQLRTYVDAAGRVAYRDWFDRDLEALQAYLQQLAAADPSTGSTPEQLSFWINAYNAGTIWAVAQGRSAESLLGRGKLFKFWKFDVAGRARTLDEVEHQILRKQFDEPRMHFAIVCASTSCPPLRAEAYAAERIDAQLQEQARRFVNDPERNIFDRAGSRIRLSKIFDWFSEDFERHGSLLDTIAPFVLDPTARAWLEAGAVGADIGHLSYDWTLNAQVGQRPR